VHTARRTRSFATVRGKVIGRQVTAAPGPAGREGWGRGGGYQPKAKRSVAEQRLAAIGDDVVVHCWRRVPSG
jgi:hypothetical protein